MTSPPRYVRFARCLALVSGLSACGSATASSSSASTTTTASASTSPSSSGPTTNRPTTLAMCDCTCGSATHEHPSCYDVGMSDCCSDVVEGPLPPPDLAV